MREILFRGKRKDNGEWVCGSLSSEYLQECGCVMISPSSDTCYKVDPKTVGQFTGLTDKNGKKIFEGDIVRDAQSFLFGKVIYATPQDGFDGIAGYMVDDIDDGPQNYNGFWNQVEVIGNIHDNPELLEVTDNA